MQYLITAALPYINNIPHLGHIIGSHLPADIFSRYCKLKGHDCLLIGGSDEYGTPAVMAAKKIGGPVRRLVDTLHPIHKRIYEWFNIAYDHYSRTSTELHSDNVKTFFMKLHERGYIRQDELEMYYCEQEALFLADRFVTGTCPQCSYGQARGDQCEQCGYMINVGDLIGPVCINCQGKATTKKSEHLFFELSRLEPQVRQFVEGKRHIWRPTVVDITNKWLTEGLQDRCITRDLPWGVSVPLAGFENKVLYVWFDALLGYMTFTKELGRDVYRKCWEDPETRIVHFLGKDNIPFHTVFWPAMLVAHHNINLPYNVAGYQYLTFEGKKFSKSKQVGVFCYSLMDAGINVDAVRSYLVQILPETKDADFKWEEFKALVNSELIGKFGNFFHRTLSMIQSYFDGQLALKDTDGLDTIEARLVEHVKRKIKVIDHLMETISLRDAYREIINLSVEGNKFIDAKAPWNLIKQGRREEAQRVLYLAMNLAKTLVILAYPFTPKSMEDVWANQLNMHSSLKDGWEWVSSMLNLPLDHTIRKPTPMYQKIEDSDLEVYKRRAALDYDLEAILSI